MFRHARVTPNTPGIQKMKEGRIGEWADCRQTSCSSMQSASLFPDLWMDQGPLNTLSPEGFTVIEENGLLWNLMCQSGSSSKLPSATSTVRMACLDPNFTRPVGSSCHFWQSCSRLLPWHIQWWTTFLEILAMNFWKVPQEKFLRLLVSKPWLNPLRDPGAHMLICFRVLYLQTYPLLPQIAGYSPCTSALIFLWLKFLCDFWPALWAPLTQCFAFHPSANDFPRDYIFCPCFCPPYNFSGDHLSCLTGSWCIDWVWTSSWWQILICKAWTEVTQTSVLRSQWWVWMVV